MLKDNPSEWKENAELASVKREAVQFNNAVVLHWLVANIEQI